ncbi:neuroplastin-like [Pomacea canaliculata]|uniref:neuroplastin-like n=1 Tax=Pomacea canaliculata TaxID=400727 RepID=UPI000D72FB9B|nr:neuroplastin-like [Pomacea canaliculata]
MLFRIGALLFCILLTDNVGLAIKIMPGYAEYMVLSDEKLVLNCSNTPVQGALKWYRNDILLNSDTSANLEIRGKAESGDNVSILTYSPVSENRSGEYKCKSEVGTSPPSVAAEAKITVFDITVKTTEAEFEYKEDATLGCEVPISNVNIVWKKNNTNVSDLQTASSTAKFVQHQNGTLEFKNPTREDAGLYFCTFQTQAGQQVKIPVAFYAKPMVLPFEKSKNLVQEERLEIRCKALGYPQPTIYWFKEDVPIPPDDKESRFTLSDVDGFPNARLEIASVNFDDAGNYMCLANSTKFSDMNANQTIHIRVKDKLAALWPFLGIVAEVVVLCTIIFIYEKKRNKDANAEEDVNQDGATPEKKSEGVRHRGNTNNPRA